MYCHCCNPVKSQMFIVLLLIVSLVYVDVPKVPRSSRWLSTSIMEDVTLYSDAIYHTGNITGMVNFAPVVASLPAGTIVLEIGPHALLKSILKRGNKDVIVIPTMIKKESGVACMKRCIDAVWLSGAHFKFPRAAYVVPLKNRVQVLWDHENDWRAASYKGTFQEENYICMTCNNCCVYL